MRPVRVYLGLPHNLKTDMVTKNHTEQDEEINEGCLFLKNKKRRSEGKSSEIQWKSEFLPPGRGAPHYHLRGQCCFDDVKFYIIEYLYYLEKKTNKAT